MGLEVRTGPRRRPVTRFPIVLGAIVLGALIFRIAYIVALRHSTIAPDGFGYFFVASSVRHGHGFVNLLTGRPDANHPPAWPLTLTIPLWLGLATQLSAQVFAAFVGGATVLAVGIAGRRISSDRSGLIAATLAAFYPGLWVYEQRLLSETLLFLIVAIFVIAVYRYQAEPGRRNAAILGGLCGLLALTRSEQILLVPFVLIPLILGWRPRGVSRKRIAYLAIACITTVVVILPWTLYNRDRLKEPVLLSTSFGIAMAQGNCGSVYSGTKIGYFDLSCVGPLAREAARRGSKDPLGDLSLRHEAIVYMRHHLDRLPLVSLARQGRAWSVYKPFETLDTQLQFPQDPWWPQGLYLFFYWALIPLAAIGGVVLRRRRVSLLPLIAPFAITVVAVAMTYGEPRLRAGAEVPLVLLAAVGIEKLTSTRSGSDQRVRASTDKKSS